MFWTVTRINTPSNSRVLLFFSSLLQFATITSTAKMQTIRSDGMGGKGITFLPTSGQYNNVVLWMHGLGDTADGWSSLMPALGLSNTKFILPTANTIPITINGGYPMPGWSDIYGLDTASVEDERGFEASAARINGIVQAEIENGIQPNKIVLCGFSQGGALAFHCSLRSPHRLGGCVALSTWVPLAKDYPAQLSESSKTLPVLQVHGDSDQVVSYQWGKASHELLKTMIKEPKPEFLTIEGMGHSSDTKEIEAVSEFLKKLFK